MAYDDAYDPQGTSTSTDMWNGTNILSNDPSTSNTSNGQSKPNPRKNPLGDYPSSTYKISLYMITPDAYNDFMQRGRKLIDLPSINLYATNPDAGAYLIAQSGGIDHDNTPRAPGFKYDYYIDDLRIEYAISPSETGTSSATTGIKFNITEPYGFSFISNLKKAGDFITQVSRTRNIKDQRNASKQFFVLGIRFLGYNSDGTTIKETEGMYERYWDIVLTSIKFKIDGRVTTYNIEAAAMAMLPMGVKRGFIPHDVTAKGKTVKDLLEGDGNGAFGILTKLNKDEQENESNKEKNTYKVVFYGPGSEVIANSRFASDADKDKSKSSMGNTQTTTDVNPAMELRVLPDLDTRELIIKNDTPVLQAIQTIISQSRYLQDAMTEVNTTAKEADAETDSQKVSKNDNPVRPLRWYNVSTTLANPRFDSFRNEYAFDITYIIQTYETPVIVSSYSEYAPKYYGPVKRYEYWFTGKNSEILKYEQTLDNTYFNVALNANGSLMSTGSGAISLSTDKRPNISRLNKNDLGADAQNQYVNYLLDPGNFAEARIEIMGDPDWLIQPSIPSPDTTYNKFYGPDGYSINPYTGQVFIEIDFKEAVDYDANKGVMDINENIVFWDYPPEIKAQLRGLSYRVNRITNFFRGGRFTQELWCTVNTFGANPKTGETGADQREDTAQQAQTVSAAGGGRGFVNPASVAPDSTGTTSTNTGFRKVPPTDSFYNASMDSGAMYTSTASEQQTTNTPAGIVSNDDGNRPN